MQLDLAGREHGPLDGEVLLRHPDPIEPGRIESDEQTDGERETGVRVVRVAVTAGGVLNDILELGN